MNSRIKTSILPLLVAAGVIIAAFAVFSIFSGSGSYETTAATHDAQTSYVIDLDTEGFVAAISNGVVLVDFWATWCAPCRIQNPILEELAREIHHLADIAKLDVDNHGSIAVRFGVRSIPTLILFKDGEPVERFVGVQQKETLRAAIEKSL